MTTPFLASLFERMRLAGVTRGHARRVVLPDWWSAEAESDPRVEPEIALRAARYFSVSYSAACAEALPFIRTQPFARRDCGRRRRENRAVARGAQRRPCRVRIKGSIMFNRVRAIVCAGVATAWSRARVRVPARWVGSGPERHRIGA